MGSILAKGVEAQFSKQQEFMLEMNRVMVERQIHMQNEMRERQAAMQVAKAREMFVWLAAFYTVATAAMVAGYRRSGSRAALAPFLPLTFVTAYQGDLAYGTKLNRIRAESENVLMFERDLVEMPFGLPTVASIDAGRMRTQDEARFKMATKQSE